MRLTSGLMKYLSLLLSCLLVVHPLILYAAETIKVPIGTTITLRLMETVSSKTAEVGQRVRFSVESDVVVKGKVVVKKDATAWGEVTAASAAGMAGTAGALTVSLQTVEAVDGTMIPISATKGAKGESKLAQSVAITALCCIFAIFMKGKDVTFESGSFYSAYVLAPVEVKVD